MNKKNDSRFQSRKERLCEMKSKLMFSFLCLGLLFLTAVVVGGCAESRYSITSYYYPDWTPDGKIICEKKVDNYRSGGGYPSFGSGASLTSTNYYITTMDTQGSQETNLKEINGLGYIATSVLGNYIAYVDGNYIKIVSMSGNDINSINTGAAIENVDWSPDESRLVYGSNIDINTDKVIVINRDGTNNITLANGRTPKWASAGDVIVFSSDSGKIDFYNLNSNSTAEINNIGFHFCWFKDATRILYSNSGIWRIDVNGSNNVQLIFSNHSTPKISPDGSKILAGNILDPGIWIFNIDGTGENKIKN